MSRVTSRFRDSSVFHSEQRRALPLREDPYSREASHRQLHAPQVSGHVPEHHRGSIRLEQDDLEQFVGGVCTQPHLGASQQSIISECHYPYQLLCVLHVQQLAFYIHNLN